MHGQKLNGQITKKILGKNITFRFGMNCWALFCEKKGISLTEISTIFKDMSFEDIRLVFYCGAASYCNENDKEIDFNVFQAGIWAEQLLNTSDFDDILKTVTETTFTKGETSKEKPKERKKK
jgi:hypothetical protein